MFEFRVIDLRIDAERTEKLVEARTPVDAAQEALGLDLTRSGSKKRLACKVYWRDAKNPAGNTNMVRLYERGTC